MIWGLLSFLRGSNGKAHKGKHARRENPDPVQAEIERTKEAIEERRRNSPRFCVEDSDNRTFEPPEPCGLSFDNVNYHHRVQGDKETGEILKDDVWVDLREPNYSANLRNIMRTLDVLDIAESEFPGFPSTAYRQLIEDAYANGCIERKGRSMHISVGINPATGKYAQRAMTFHGSYTEAVQAREDFKRKLLGMSHAESKKMTLSQCCELCGLTHPIRSTSFPRTQGILASAPLRRSAIASEPCPCRRSPTSMLSIWSKAG